MKKCIIALFAFLLAASVAFARDSINGPTNIIVTGYIIDNHCADMQTEDTLQSFVRLHTKECALMPTCAASGYSIYTSDGELLKFDRNSSIRVQQFLEQPNSKLQVEVIAERSGDELKLVSIRNQW